MWLFVAFIAIPMIEIALFIQVGGAIGLGWTLAIVLLTAILGTWLVRSQGALVLNRIRQSFSELSNPAEPLAEGAMVLFAGALLLTPGFFTDTLGFLLLIPAVRRAAFTWGRRHVHVQEFTTGPQQRPRPRPETAIPEVIEGEFTEVDPAKRPTHQPSHWTKH
ncbi:FxsA family protein [Pseudooceanicola sp.]|uniref:FxsA family protein n=1 Tax=Pseudooceanicola sp. TaxID=1914328 RepID=UPI00261E8709|nr:FxsA family protein [Pseudooceanicola sp.]MDF1854945.1 FxsA family protein [Pseudooceanicola sp.]